MNVESEVKDILIMGMSPEKRAKKIAFFTVFSEEDIITALKEGGKNVSEIYRNLVNLSGKRK